MAEYTLRRLELEGKKSRIYYHEIDPKGNWGASFLADEFDEHYVLSSDVVKKGRSLTRSGNIAVFGVAHTEKEAITRLESLGNEWITLLKAR